MGDEEFTKEAYEQMDKLFGGMFSKQLGSFEDLMDGINKEKKRRECKHSPDLTKMIIICGKCGVKMVLGDD